MYGKYLFLITQLFSLKKAKLELEGRLFEVEELPHKRWRVCALLCGNEEKLSSELLRSLAPSGALKWQTKGAYLQVDQEGKRIYLQQEMEALKGYLSFREWAHDFIQIAAEWEEVVRDLAGSV